jgi:hypothetical protein
MKHYYLTILHGRPCWFPLKNESFGKYICILAEGYQSVRARLTGTAKTTTRSFTCGFGSDILRNLYVRREGKV